MILRLGKVAAYEKIMQKNSTKINEHKHAILKRFLQRQNHVNYL